MCVAAVPDDLVRPGRHLAVDQHPDQRPVHGVDGHAHRARLGQVVGDGGLGVEGVGVAGACGEAQRRDGFRLGGETHLEIAVARVARRHPRADLHVLAEAHAHQLALAADRSAAAQQGHAGVESAFGRVGREARSGLVGQQVAERHLAGRALGQGRPQVQALQVGAGFREHQRPGRGVDALPDEHGGLGPAGRQARRDVAEVQREDHQVLEVDLAVGLGDAEAAVGVGRSDVHLGLVSDVAGAPAVGRGELVDVGHVHVPVVGGIHVAEPVVGGPVHGARTGADVVGGVHGVDLVVVDAARCAAVHVAERGAGQRIRDGGELRPLEAGDGGRVVRGPDRLEGVVVVVLGVG